MDVSAELKGHFLRLYQIAMTDGIFSPEEWKMLYQFGEERGVNKLDMDAVLLTTSGKLEIPESVEERIEYLYDFCRMIWVDDLVAEDELLALKKYCKLFGFVDENIDELSNYLLQCAKEGKSKYQILQELHD